MRRSWLISLLVLALPTIACTALLGDYTTGAGGGDGGPGTSGGPNGPCDATQKTCGGTCVSKDAPLTGCATDSCSPCPPTTNGDPACKAGACSFVCTNGFTDCDGNPANGCEVNTASDVASCGKCGDACGTANTLTAPKCVANKCVFTCKKDFAHCGGPMMDTGCDTDLANDMNNCGQCGHSCLGGKCTGGKCEPLQLARVSNPSGLAVDMTHVYFTFPSVPAIQRVERNGKCTPAAPCPQEFAGSGVGDPLGQIRGPSAIVSDGTTVWWTNQANGNLGKRAAAITNPPSAIVNFGSAVSTEPGYVVLAGGKIWWTNAFANSDPTPHVRRADLDGSNVTTVATYMTPASTFYGFGGITADATHVYWASKNSGVFRAAFNDPPCVEGSTCKQFGASSPYGVAVDATFVYWTEPSSGTVRRAPKAGGGSLIVASGQDNPKAIAVQGAFVYWGNAGSPTLTNGSIRRAPLVGAVCDGAACELVADVNSPDAIVAADDGIYWTNNNPQGGVFRLAK
ncbi:MAG: hypothetical protein JWP87_5875 [Labilithrix sp.]|nr:hypothetical protein [Labilithrix sp.]